MNTAGFVGRLPKLITPSSKLMFGTPSLFASSPRLRRLNPKRTSLTVVLETIHV